MPGGAPAPLVSTFSLRAASVNAVATQRLRAMLDFVETMDRWSTEMLSVPPPKLASMLRLGARIVSLLPLGRAK